MYFITLLQIVDLSGLAEFLEKKLYICIFIHHER